MNIKPNSLLNTSARDSIALKRVVATQDIRYTNQFFFVFFVVGLLVILLHTFPNTLERVAVTTTALLWVMACLISGAAVGFLFGIPKVLQENRPASKQVEGTQASNTLSDAAIDYRQQVNTNLTEISDWLTKIIVGLGLINLGKIPPYLNSMADALALSMNSSDASKEKGFAFALITCFSIFGFLFGYLYTRLFLAGAFSRADRVATEAKAKIQEIIDTEARAALVEEGRQPTERQLAAAQKVEQLASQTDISLLRQQMSNLAREYEGIRATMAPSDERTRKMELVVAGMRTLALACYPLLTEFANSQSEGDRLAAVTMLQVKADPAYLDWLATRITVEKPFVGYHAAVALLFAARSLPDSERPKLKDAINKVMSQAVELKGTDRYGVLEEARNELLEIQ